MANETVERKIAEALSSLTGARPHIVQHLMYMLYLERLHELSLQVITSDSKMHNFDIVLPYMGTMHFTNENGEIKLSGMDLSKGFIKDLDIAVNKGESKLLNSLNDRFIRMLNDTYKELL